MGGCALTLIRVWLNFETGRSRARTSYTMHGVSVETLTEANNADLSDSGGESDSEEDEED